MTGPVAGLGRRPDDRWRRRLGGDHRVADRPVVGDVAIGRVGDQRGAQRPVAVVAGRDVGDRLPRGPGARDADLDLDGVDAAGPDLPPQRAAREVEPHRVGEVRERGLGLAVGVVQARLPAGVALAAAEPARRPTGTARAAGRADRARRGTPPAADRGPGGRATRRAACRAGWSGSRTRRARCPAARCCPGSGPTAA